MGKMGFKSSVTVVALGVLVLWQVYPRFDLEISNTEVFPSWPGTKSLLPNKNYQLTTVEIGTISSNILAVGRVNPMADVEVGSQISGRVDEVFVGFGDSVSAGDLLARMDTSHLEARVAEAKANLAVAVSRIKVSKATVDETQLKRNRVFNLRQSGNATKQKLEEISASLARAKADLESSEAQFTAMSAQLMLANTRLAYAEIRSPIDGIVLDIAIAPGQTVAASLQSPRLFVIAKDLSTVAIHVNIDESDISRVEVHQNVSFSVDAFPGFNFTGQVQEIRIMPEISQNIVSYRVIISADNPSEVIFPGMTAMVKIEVSSKGDVLKVPNAALLFRPRDESDHFKDSPMDAQNGELVGRPATVWKLNSEGALLPVSIQIGVSDESGAEVVFGDIKEGDELVSALLRKRE
jgi:HlyD family secretion protein